MVINLMTNAEMKRIPTICDTTSTEKEKSEFYPPLADLCSFAGTLEGDLYLPSDQSFSIYASSANNFKPNNPGIVIVPLTTDDVTFSVLFAERHNLRVTVASSGHDFYGRSSGTNQLHINMGKMKGMLVNKNDQRSSSGISGTMGPGVVTMLAYQELDQWGLTLPGGWCPGVCLGGYIGGGGTGPLNRLYGYGADNMIGATLVTANGTVLTVNRQGVSAIYADDSKSDYTDPELFRALRGGVGGTYGIITEYQYTLYKSPPTSYTIITMSYLDHNGAKVGQKAIKYFLEWLLLHHDNNKIGGLFSIEQRGRGEGSIRFYLTYYGKKKEGAKVLKQFTDKIQDYSFGPAKIKYSKTFKGFASLLNGGYSNDWTYPVSRFLGYNDILLDKKGHNQILKAVDAYFKSNIWVCSFEITGGQGKTYEHKEETSISDGFRQSEMVVLCFSKNLESSTTKSVRDFADNYLYTMGTGIHPNEADFDLRNWKTEMWGSTENYERLLKVKERYDPNHLFTCPFCVGSEESNSQFKPTDTL